MNDNNFDELEKMHTRALILNDYYYFTVNTLVKDTKKTEYIL